MKWYYESNGNPHGPVEEAELRQLKDDGKLPGDALVWRQGMKDWTPFNAVSDFDTHSQARQSYEKTLPPAPSGTVSETQHPNPPHHAEEEPSTPQSAFHPNHPNHSDAEFPSEPRRATSRTRPEWEHSDEVGPLGAFVMSVRDILIDPRETFQNLNPQGGWGMPLVFLLIAEIIGNIFMVLTVKQVPLSASPAVALLKQALQMDKGETVLFYSSAASISMLPLAILIKAVVIHTSLKWIGRSVAPFSTTFRALCYALGAGSMLWSIPLLAVSIAAAAGDSAATVAALFLASASIGMWSAWINLRALASAHGLSLLRTLVSVAGPPFLIALLSALFLGAVATLAQA